MSKKDIINKAIQYMSPANLELANKKYGTNYSKDELYLEDNPEKGLPETFCVHVTDLHYGKKTCTYDTDACTYHTIGLIKNLQTISDIEHRSRSFQSLYILDTGDMMDGFDIYPTHAAGHVDPANVNHQIFGVIRAFYNPLVKFGLDNFPEVIICKVPGNHGRLGFRHAEGSNLDCMTTAILREKYEGNDRVKVIGGDNFLRVFDVNNHKVLLFHGAAKSIRSFYGLPWYGIDRALSRWATDESLDFDIACMGHFHRNAYVPVMSGKQKMCFMSGTMATGDDYSIENYGMDGDNRWWCFGLHPDRKTPTFQYLLDLVKES